MTPSDCRYYATRARELGLITVGRDSVEPPSTAESRGHRNTAPLARNPRQTVAEHLPLVQKIQHATCAHYQITLGEMLHESRLTAEISWARAVAVHLCCELLVINRHDLARAFCRTTGALKYQRDLVAHRIATSQAAADEVRALTTFFRSQIKIPVGDEVTSLKSKPRRGQTLCTTCRPQIANPKS